MHVYLSLLMISRVRIFIYLCWVLVEVLTAFLVSTLLYGAGAR